MRPPRLQRRLRALATVVAVLVLWAPPSSAKDSEAPLIEHTEVTQALQGQPLSVRAKIQDESGIFDPTVLFRVGSTGEFTTLSMESAPDGKDEFVAVIPASALGVDVTQVEYFIEAFDMEGNGPARFGEVELPITVKVVPPPTQAPDETPDPVRKTPEPSTSTSTTEVDGADEGGGMGWLVWTGAGVGGVVLVGALVGGGVAAWYFLQPTEPDRPSEVQLQIISPLPTTSALLGTSGGLE